MVNSHAGRFEPGWNESILAIARSKVSCTRSSARSPLPESEIANARRLGTDARMSSRRESVRGISPSPHFWECERPYLLLGGQAPAHQAFESGPRAGPAPPGVRHRRTWHAVGVRFATEFRH